MNITNSHPATNAEWDEIWKNCDHATYFHSREWAEIWQEYTKVSEQPYQYEPLIVSFSDGKRTLLPISSYANRNGEQKEYIASPAGTFGGWISVNELTVKHYRLLISLLKERYRPLLWRMNPYNEMELRATPPDVKPETTSVLALTGNFEDIFRRWSKGHKAAVNQARKAGVLIKQAESLDEWRGYYEVYCDSIRRWGETATMRYPWKIFEVMQNCHSSNIKLWIALKNNNLIAGALCFYAKCHAVYWHGAALDEYFSLRPVNLLLYEAIKDAHSAGFKWFDFNPSGHLEGVRAFKKSFGTVEKLCPAVVLKPVVNLRQKIRKTVGSALYRVRNNFSNAIHNIVPQNHS
ncbi:MAG: GNAT family N-acetyltransferase [Bacteroidetes bacterium]|nr:GNAT family N-acetyltransferase [Bacteroidota bacterium]